ncbi:MAG TPA: cytochrome P450, partial [Acidimicrobiales bacterium]|nr:cytochrome P450 [Acidimicrobiales bacterium]
MLTAQSIADPEFWQQPLADRMAQFAILREEDPFLRVTFPDPVTGQDDDFFAVTRYQDVVEISKRPLDFCSGQGSTSIADLPIEAMEFFGSFITMDDPRHARQRGIVARAFTPRQLASVLDSVERICTEVVDGMCEKGEVDLVEAVSQPFPLLIICDMMGIPRSEFDTVLRATNVILGAGDPDMVGTSNPEEVLGALLNAGMELAGLMNELAEQRRLRPADDLTSALVHNDIGEEMLAPHELAPFFILLAVAGNDTTRTAISHGMSLLTQNPGERARWQADLDGATPTAVEEIIRV